MYSGMQVCMSGWIQTMFFSAGRGYVTVHASSDGNKKVELPEVSNVSEIFAASHDRKGVKAIRENMRKGETRVWRLHAP